METSKIPTTVRIVRGKKRLRYERSLVKKSDIQCVHPVSSCAFMISMSDSCEDDLAPIVPKYQLSIIIINSENNVKQVLNKKKYFRNRKRPQPKNIYIQSTPRTRDARF